MTLVADLVTFHRVGVTMGAVEQIQHTDCIENLNADTKWLPLKCVS